MHGSLHEGFKIRIAGIVPACLEFTQLYCFVKVPTNMVAVTKRANNLFTATYIQNSKIIVT